MPNLNLEILEIMHGDTQVQKIMKGDVQKWPYVPYDSQVEYLQGDGVARIDTGVDLTSDTRFVIVLNIPADSTGWLFGGRGTYDTNNKQMAVSRGSSTFSWRWNKGVYAGPSVNTEKAYNVVFDNYSTSGANVCSIDGTTVNGTSGTFSSNYNFMLFRANDAGTILQGIPGLELVSAKIYSGSTLVRDYIPVRKDGIGYLYDKVNEQLVGTLSGTFSYGNDV